MSGLADLAQSLIASVASPLSRDFQADIVWKAWESTTGDGDDTFDTTGVQLKALVDRTVKQHYTGDGRLVQVVATLTILDPITNNGASGRKNPIDPRDHFFLDDGTTAPIVELPQFENPATGAPFLVTVILGKVLA